MPISYYQCIHVGSIEGYYPATRFPRTPAMLLPGTQRKQLSQPKRPPEHCRSI
jgi:hypothetical protein